MKNYGKPNLVDYPYYENGYLPRPRYVFHIQNSKVIQSNICVYSPILPLQKYTNMSLIGCQNEPRSFFFFNHFWVCIQIKRCGNC